MRIVVAGDALLARFAGLIDALPVKARRAFVEGLNEGGDLERTQVKRDLREQTGVSKAGTIAKHTATRRASSGDLEYRILGLGKGLPIKDFPVRAGTRSPVTALPWGVSHVFERSFRTSRLGLLRARRGASRMPIRALYGPSIAKEIVKDRTAAGFRSTAAPLVERAVIKRLGRMLP